VLLFFPSVAAEMARAALLSVGLVEASHIQAPGGKLVHRDCYHEVPHNTHINDVEGKFIFTFPNGTVVEQPHCAAEKSLGSSVGHGSAWKAWAQFQLPGSTSVSYLTNSWNVPHNPSNVESQLLYYWNGIEDGGDSGGVGVLQPVLQFTGGQWGIKSWYVGSGGTITSGLVTVAPGSNVVGTMTKESDGSWTCEFEGQDATLKYNRHTLTFTHAYEVLEAYSLGSQCSLYPSEPCVFTNTKISFDGEDASDKVEWVPYSCPSGPGCTDSASCSETATINGGDVTISTRSSIVV